MPPLQDVVAAFEDFTIFEILTILDPLVLVPRKSKRKRLELVQFLEKLDDRLWSRVLQAAGAVTGSKRKRRDDPEVAGPTIARPSASKRPRLVSAAAVPALSGAALGPEVHEGDEDDLVAGHFLRVPSTEVVNSCISRFIDRTGNAALQKAICMVCARLLLLSDLIACEPEELQGKICCGRRTHIQPTIFIWTCCFTRMLCDTLDDTSALNATIN
uniref:Uncharacterized protein n=1 Tax=Mycena chlorophos TaxID=658473 RepID=A0ABQ0M1S5_MYCCL|nr:predicted protein [Mycena chlorophos]